MRLKVPLWYTPRVHSQDDLDQDQCFKNPRIMTYQRTLWIPAHSGFIIPLVQHDSNQMITDHWSPKECTRKSSIVPYMPTLQNYPGVSQILIQHGSPALLYGSPYLSDKIIFWAFRCIRLRFSPFLAQNLNFSYLQYGFWEIFARI